MGELMRWRLARAPQRRIPEPDSIVPLGEPYQIPASVLKSLEGLAIAGAGSATYTMYSQILKSQASINEYLTPLTEAVAALSKLDRWLASVDSKPDVAALNQTTKSLLGQYLPNKPEWQKLRKTVAELYYANLILSAITINAVLIDAQSYLTRLLLLVALVDTLQQNKSPISTTDDVYAALRWRTLILPEEIVAYLRAIRLSKAVVFVRKPGFADLFITREEWDHYEAAEIASIENILAGELKSRVHVLVNQTQVTTTNEQITTTVKEQDTTTTDLTQLQRQSTSDISLAAHIDGQVNTSGQYGPTQVNTHIGGSLDYSSSTSESKATTQSHETVSRAVNSIEQTTRQVRTVSTLTRATDKEVHKFDNQKEGAGSVVGIYRWVDQIQNVELDRYPHRLLMEFEIPEPGAWTRWLHLNDLARNMINKPPAPLTLDAKPITAINPPLQATDLTAATYNGLAARYTAAGVSPPPLPMVVAVNITYPSSGTPPSPAEFRFQAISDLPVPTGYSAKSGTASILAAADRTIAAGAIGSMEISLGAGPPKYIVGPFGKPPTALQVGGAPGISQGSIPISIEAYELVGFSVTVEVYCEPLDQTYKQWQNDTYGLIVGAYNSMLQAFNDEKAGLTIQQLNLADANSPNQNSQTVKQELKRQVIEMLIGTTLPDLVGTTSFLGRNAINWDGQNQPTIQLATAVNVAPEIQFLEQVFEWETLSYICYPYYWADSSRWADLAVIQGNDPNFADFLRAGSTRVVLAARPGFEDQVNFYTSFGILWGGGPMPSPGDEGYLSIADEIKAQQQRPLDVSVVDAWQVRLPTTLIWLENANGLPKNPSPTITPFPRILNVVPAIGPPGASMSIIGTGLGEEQGGSTVTFNGIAAAAATTWKTTLIVVDIPNGATTGDVLVTVNALPSNKMTFTVQ